MMQTQAPMAQNLAQFAAAGQPPMPPPGGPAQMPPGMPPQGMPRPMPPPQQQPPPQLPQGAQQPPQGGPGGLALTPVEMAKLGRFGDSIIAHLTPGEIQVPPQLQSAKVLSALKKEAEKKHVRIEQFMAGNPAQSHNPATGAPEFSFWSALLPAALGVAGGAVGSLIAPGIGTAIGAGLGSSVGTAATGGNAAQIGLSGLGGAVGGYFGGAGIDSLTAGSGAAAGAGAGASALPSNLATSAPMDAGIIGNATAAGSTSAATQPLANAAAQAATTGATMTPVAGAGSGVGTFSATAPQGPASIFSRAGLMGLGKAGAAIGLGSSIGTAVAPVSNSTPAPFGANPHMPPVNMNYQQLLGNNGASPTPQFTNYNPIAAVSGQPYNFYPQS